MNRGAWRASRWGFKESDMTKELTHTHTHTHTYNLYIGSKGRRRQWHPTPVLLPGKSYGRRSLVGCSPWGR